MFPRQAFFFFNKIYERIVLSEGIIGSNSLCHLSRPSQQRKKIEPTHNTVNFEDTLEAIKEIYYNEANDSLNYEMKNGLEMGPGIGMVI